MNRRSEAALVLQQSAECARSPPLPADHVLCSGAVLFPGVWDQHGSPLVVFPVDGQAKLSTALRKAEVVDFIHYCLCQHSNKKQEKGSLVSVVADLRGASPSTTRFICETLLLLELQKETVHSVYIIQPKKKDVLRLLLKLLAPSKSHPVCFKKVLLTEVFELSKYIDRSQLMASLGGYFIYCHQSWVAFIKEIDAFVQDFLSVVQRLPSCISTLQAMSRLSLPSTFTELQHFCTTSEAKFKQLRRELGLDELLRHCESLLQKLCHPEQDPCYQSMAGTALFTQTTYTMLQNHSRITAALLKVEDLWQQAFSKARIQLQVLQLRDDALQITEQIESLLQHKLQPYRIRIAGDAAKANDLASEFNSSIYTPAMALVGCAEEVVRTLAELLSYEAQARERWIVDLERLKEKLHSTVHFTLQTLRALSNYQHYYTKAQSWYRQVLSENFLQELISGVEGASNHRRQRRSWGTIPAWRKRLSAFLKKNPPPDLEELIHLSHLSGVIPDEQVQREGKQLSQRCLTLRRLIICSEPVPITHLQVALQWQYELLRSSQVKQFSADRHIVDSTHNIHSPSDRAPLKSQVPNCHRLDCDLSKCKTSANRDPNTSTLGLVSAEGKPSSLSSFDSGFEGAASSQLEGPEALLSGVTRNFVKNTFRQPQIDEETASGLSDSDGFGSLGNSSRASIHVVPKVTLNSLNLEIKVTRLAALPSNPWLSLPVEDLENAYTVTITQKPSQHSDSKSHDPSATQIKANQGGCREHPFQTPVVPQHRAWALHSQSLEDYDLSPIGHVLSSTITEAKDKSNCTTAGIPTMLWDSYDLHEQYLDATDGVSELSLKDWDIKEEENLNMVEKILGRANEILAEEENVLAQEVELDVLLSVPVVWSVLCPEDQLGHTSTTELTKAGVLGLDDDIPAESETEKPPGSSETSEKPTCTTEAPLDAVWISKPNLLTQLWEVQALDQRIIEENLKIQELGLQEAIHSSSDAQNRQSLRLQLEKEKEELEKMEKGLERNCKVRKHEDRETKVIRCSIMARTESKDGAICDELLSGQTSSHSAQDQSHLASQSSQTEVMSKQRLSIVTKLNHTSCSEGSGRTKAEFQVNFFGPKQHLYRETGLSNTSKNVPEELPATEGTLVMSGIPVRPSFDLCVNPEHKARDKAFDPGGDAHPRPLPKPRKTSLPNDKLTEQESPHSCSLNTSPSSSDPISTQLDLQLDQNEQPNSATPDTCEALSLSPNVKEHSNYNHLQFESEVAVQTPTSSNLTTKTEDELQTDDIIKAPSSGDPSGEGPCLEKLPLCPGPNCPMELYPAGSGLESSEATEMSAPGIQAPLTSHRSQPTGFGIPIVLDTGSGLMKAGFADQNLPNIIFPTMIGVPKYEEIMNGSTVKDTYIGHEAQHMRGVLALRHPIKNGIISNWDDMEKIWHYTFELLRVDPAEHPVLLSEAPMNPLENRQRTVEIMFECFGVPFSYMAMQAVLALHAAGRTTGVVFDSGDGISHSVPVFDGYPLPHAAQRFPLAGTDVTMHLKKLLQEQGVCMRTTAEMEIVREMKEKCCCMALNYEDELRPGALTCGDTSYTLPDGQTINLGSERLRAPEILFKPELIGRDHYGMHESIFKSILSSDIDLRCCFLGNILLSGGNTLLRGLPERLQAEITGLVPSNQGHTVRVTSPKDRDSSVWSGGAVLANLPSFNAAWISQEEYIEYGPQIVYRKCF